jgi:hypothetical protein
MSSCLLIVIASLVGQTPESLGWKRYQPQGSGFSVALPSIPQEGRKGDAVGLLVADGVCVYYAGQRTIDIIPSGRRKEFYDSFTDSTVKDAKGKLIGEKDINISGVPGREITIDGYSSLDIKLGKENPGKVISKVRFAVSGTRRYLLFAEYPPDLDPQYAAKLAKVFLESCKITD